MASRAMAGASEVFLAVVKQACAQPEASTSGQPDAGATEAVEIALARLLQAHRQECSQQQERLRQAQSIPDGAVEDADDAAATPCAQRSAVIQVCWAEPVASNTFGSFYTFEPISVLYT